METEKQGKCLFSDERLAGDMILKTAGITKRYGGKCAVDKVNVHVRRGDIYGLIGRNGAGKTTLMKVILGLAHSDSGEIDLFGSKDLAKGRKRVGSLIEAPGLYKGCSAYENMKRFCMLYGTDYACIDGLLSFVGLADAGNKKAGQFSLGMKQRLGIAIALIGDPELLVLDEPINGLDPAGIKEMRDLFLKLSQKGVTLIISSHILEELEKVATVFGIINEGKLVEEVSVAELERRCGQYVRIKTLQDERAYSVLEKAFDGIEIKMNDRGVYVNGNAEKSHLFNKTLVENGIDVKELHVINRSAEDYFIERMGR